jgi:hypothetical protein
MSTATIDRPAADSVVVEVPVPTVFTKSVLVGALGQALAQLQEGLVDRALEDLWGMTDYLTDDYAADEKLNTYAQAMAPARELEDALLSLGALAPGDGVVLRVSRMRLERALNGAMEYMIETDVSTLLRNTCTQRQVAEAQIVISDMLDAVDERLYVEVPA